MLKTIIIFLNVLLMAYCCLAVKTGTDFEKYGFSEDKNILIERAIWGYRLRYLSKKANSYAYVLAKIPQALSSHPEKEKISFHFKARLYPVAPNTHDMRRAIKAYVKNSLGHTKVHKHKNGVISAPAFVLSANDNIKKKTAHCSFPIQYSKRSDALPEQDPKGKEAILIFKDSRLLPLNLFRNYDIEVTFDYPNRIVSFNSNGNKIILKDYSMRIWQYYGLATFFSPQGPNRNTVIALEYEFNNIKIGRNITRIDNQNSKSFFPRFTCTYYEDLIEKEKDIDAMYCLGMNYYEGKGGAEKDYYQAFKWLKKAAMHEHVFAQYQVGLCHLYGLGTEKNHLLAWKWLHRSSKYFYDKAQAAAAQCIIDKVKITNDLNRPRLLQSLLGPAFFQGNANACFLQSYCAQYDISKTGINYLDGFKDAARRGHPKAFYYLGMHFAKNKQMKIAFKCYFEAAERGFVPACVKLGACYQAGLGTKKDLDEAFKLFEKAANSGNPEGIFKLACCYLLGQGVKKDKKQAVKLFKIAAVKSSPRALIALLFLQEGNLQSSFFTGNDKAASDESKNSKNGSYYSRRAISLKYGIGTTASRSKALKFLQRSSKYNHWMAFELADSYENNRNKSREFYKAINLYKKSVTKGDSRALRRLGKLYFKIGNKFEAMLHYQEAAKKGNAVAAFELAEILMSSGTKERQKVFELFKKAAKNGHIRAWYELGDCYYKGQGVRKNAIRAAECWEKYEDAFLKQQNNSIHGLYWKDLPSQVPIKYDENGLPLKYHSDLKDETKILEYYNKY